MPQPVILTVDDDPEVLRALEGDVRREYGDRYWVVGAGSGPSALALIDQLRQGDQTLALVVADYRMSGMDGSEFLQRVEEAFPHAKRVLLVTYDDVDSAVRTTGEADLDHYLVKPWDSPERHLYPILTVLLDAWQASYRRPFDELRLIGHRWSPATHEIRDFLARNLVPYRWLNIETDPEARRLIEQDDELVARLPVVLFSDGARLVKPTIDELAERIGLHSTPERAFYDLIIIGAGPAGLSTGVYAASEGVRTVLIEREAPGGQAGMSASIENYPGFPSGLSGADLARRSVVQAERFGAEILTPRAATELRLDGQYRIVRLDDEEDVCGRAVVIAVGVSYRTLDVPGVDRLTGSGVYYGSAMSEGETCRNEDIYIVGGANSAGQAAMYFSRYARTVTMLVRGPSLSESMSQYLIDEIEETPNIIVRTNTTVTAVNGDERLEAISVRYSDTGEDETLASSSMFIFIGAEPHTDWLSGIIERDDGGYILTGPDVRRDGDGPHGWPLDRDPYLLETSVPGVFAIGDVRHGSVQRVTSAIGEGSMVVAFIHQYLQTV